MRCSSLNLEAIHDDGLVHCRLEIVSLLDYTSDYYSFLTLFGGKLNQLVAYFGPGQRSAFCKLVTKRRAQTADGSNGRMPHHVVLPGVISRLCRMSGELAIRNGISS